MKWYFPAKTFLLGEYVAVAGGPALLVTTAPLFELHQTDEPGLHGIHPESPAGRWWLQHSKHATGLQWHDPYQGCGGMGASSAQFLGVYLATNTGEKHIDISNLLDAYLRFAWQGNGLRPSGYDVIAQSMHDCVYINNQQKLYQSSPWPFDDLVFILIHTGQKLATHEHLQTMALPSVIDQLITVVESAKAAFELADRGSFINAVNAYYQQLLSVNLVAKHTQALIEQLSEYPEILGMKGCGAMGSDVILLLLHKEKLASVSKNLADVGCKIIATSDHLYDQQ